MIVYLPRQFQLNAVNKFTSMIVRPDGNPIADLIVLDCSKMAFIDGSGYTVLSNSIGWLVSRGVRVKLNGFKNTNNLAIQYLDDCGFFRRYLAFQLRKEAKVRETTLPCCHVSHVDGFGFIEHKLSPWLQRTFGLPYDSFGSIRTCVKEVLNNIADHSQVNTGFIHAQHYPNMHNIKITMSDFGEGIPATIIRRFGAMSDSDAIILATREGVTSQSRPNNMGAGLSYLVDTTITNKGVVRLHSRSGNITCVADKVDDRSFQRRGGAGIYPGTLVELELDTRLFEGDEVERTDFEW